MTDPTRPTISPRCLVYLRFDDAGVVQTYHVGCQGLGNAPVVLARARERGLTPGATLVEYAVFSSLRMIHTREAPNFHYLTWDEFFARTGGDPVWTPGLTGSTLPGGPAEHE